MSPPSPAAPTTVSVALATYNGARFLAAQLESIAAQDQRPDEIVIGDDQSTDATPTVVADFARRTGLEVHFTRNPERLGSSANFAAILGRCRGDVILLSDQDDVWAPHRVRSSLEQLARHPQVGMAFSDAALISDSGDRLSGSLWKRAFFAPRLRALFRAHRGAEVSLKMNMVTGATMAIRREALACALPIPRGWVHDAWLAFLIEVVHGALPIEDQLISYRLHGAQQIGVLSLAPRALVALVQRQDARFYRTEAANFRALAERLTAMGPSYAEVASGARAKADFLERRASGREDLGAFVQNTGRALVHRSYSRYGLGPKQLAFDLVGATAAALGRARQTLAR